MNAFLESLQSSAFAEWVLVSTWGYPILLTLHSIGLALLAGILSVIGLRILGVARGVPLPPFRNLMRFVWAGFIVNAASGLAIFVSDASKYYYSTTFRLKLLFILAGIVIALVINSSVLGARENFDRKDASMAPSAKIFAGVSLAAWLGAIVAGRLMAYV